MSAPRAALEKAAQGASSAGVARARPDRRLSAIVITVVAIVALGGVIGFASEIAQWMGRMLEPPHVQHAREARKREIDKRFEQAVIMLHAKRYDHAVAALHRLLELAPDMPEAHVNMGYALLGAGNPVAARDFFASATELRPQQANAYYGLAVALEAVGDLPAARGAMRTFVHLSPPGDPYVRKANAALWEWENKHEKVGPDEHALAATK